jgi:hypothetical protein
MEAANTKVQISHVYPAADDLDQRKLPKMATKKSVAPTPKRSIAGANIRISP